MVKLSRSDKFFVSIIVFLASIYPLFLFYNFITDIKFYSNTKWLTVHGYKSKGYVPYLQAAYGTDSSECSEYIIGLDYELSKEKKLIYQATTSNDDLQYTIKYPMNFWAGGCEYWFVRGYVNIEEPNNLDEEIYGLQSVKRVEQIFAGFITAFDIRYHEPNETYYLDPLRANPKYLNIYCQRYLACDLDKGEYICSRPKRKVMRCHPEGYDSQESYYLFEPYMVANPNLNLNIVLSEDVKLRGTPQDAKRLGLEEFPVDKDNFLAKKEYFQAFKTKYNIKDAKW